MYQLSTKQLKKNINRGTAYVVGSAASMDYVNPSFFDDKIVFGCNFVFRKFNTRYTVCKDLSAQEIREASKTSTVIMSQHPAGNLSTPIDKSISNLDIDHYVFPHRTNKCSIIEWDEMDEDEIVVSWSTITSAMHIAAYMGYKNIYLMGVDGGKLDGKTNYDGYANHTEEQQEWYEGWVEKILDQTIFVRNKLQEKYGCHIMLVSPFVNFRLEGHKFE